MPFGRLNLEDFPDSAYAHELRRGVKSMRFEAPLEAEFLTAHLERVRLRVRFWFALNVLLAAAVTFELVRRSGFWNVHSLVSLGLFLPCAATLMWLSWGSQYGRFYIRFAPLLVALLYALFSVFVASGLDEGHFELLGPLAVILVAAFFFSGLLFRHALAVSVIMLGAFAASAAVADLDRGMFVKSLVLMAMTGAVAAFVYRDVEQSYRRSFLESALINQLVGLDALSGLTNRRAFDEHLLRVWQHALRDQRSIALLMVDIDHFKQYNDQFGHQAGDLALRSVAQVVKGFARRPLDLAARYGGEEFAVILYDLAPVHVRDTAEQLRAAVQDLKIGPPAGGQGGESREITVSVGVGIAAPTLGRTFQGAVQLADEAMYEAKHAGRNCIAVKGAEAYELLETGAFSSPRDKRRLPSS